MNKKIVMSGLSILTAFAMMGGSAFAAFTTTATATGNTFSTSNPQLLVNVNNGGDGASVPGATVTGLVPGVAGAAQSFVLHNIDASATQTVTLQLVNLPANTLPGDDLTIAVTCAGGINEIHTYSDWIVNARSLGTIAPSTTLACTMTPTLNAGVGNADLNKSAIFDAVFTGSVGL
jgi:hypothetical protein